MTKLQNCVLIVDDEFLIAMGLSHQVQDMGLSVCGTAATAEDAISMAQTHRPAVVLMDVRLKGQGDGVDAAIAIHQAVGSKVVFITGSKEDTTIRRIEQDHPFAVLFKPVAGRQLHRTVEDALRAALA